MKKIKKILIIILVLLSGIYFGFDDVSEITSLATMVESPQTSYDVGDITVLFCPKDNCTRAFLDITENKEIKCAMYDLDQPLIKERIGESSFPLIIDDETKIEGLTNTIKDSSSGLMHNKFCIINESIVWTGSMNPTDRGTSVNNNNVIIIHSKKIASNYIHEYEEMRSGIFHKGDQLDNPITNLGDTKITTAFCPDDGCQEQVLTHLKSAQSSIYFMTFSFTDYKIANILIEKSKSMPVQGIMEKSQAKGTYSVLPAFTDTPVMAQMDESSRTMHHKVFIIDESIVITGSYNPTKSGNERNDENLLIIESKEIAKQFLAEFTEVRNQE